MVCAQFEETFKRLLHMKPLRTRWSSFEIDSSTASRVAGARCCFPSEKVKTISRGFCIIRPYFIFKYKYDSSCFFTEHRQPGRQTTFARSALGAQMTDTDNNSSRAESYQITTLLHDVLYCSQMLLSDPGKIEDRAGTLELLFCWGCVRCNRNGSVLLL